MCIRDSHRGIYYLAIFDGGDGTAVAQMAGDDFGSFNRTVQLAVSAADKTVAGSVEAVTTDGVFLVIFIRNAEHVGLSLIHI